MRITYPYPHNLSACALSDMVRAQKPVSPRCLLLGRSIPGIVTAQGSRHAQAHGGAEQCCGIGAPRSMTSSTTRSTEPPPTVWVRRSHAMTASTKVRAAPVRSVPLLLQSARTSDSARRATANAREKKIESDTWIGSQRNEVTCL